MSGNDSIQKTAAEPALAPMSLVDIAANLTSPAFDPDRAEVIARARAAGVAALIVTGSSLADSAAAIAIARGCEICAATAGTHPHNAREWDGEPSRRRLIELAQGRAQSAAQSAAHCGPRQEALASAQCGNAEGEAPPPASALCAGGIAAIGECGLDYNRNFSPPDAQRRCFEDQLEIAARLGKPAFLHERDAFGDFFRILKERRADLPGAVVHCFTSGERELEAYLALDCHIGITGWICDERRGSHLIPLARQIPADRLLLETDAPYLLPRSMPKALRKKSGRNEPAFLPHIAAFVAEALGKSAEQLAAETGANAASLFGLALN